MHRSVRGLRNCAGGKSEVKQLWFAFEVLVNIYQIWICLYMLGKIFPPREGVRMPRLAFPLCLGIGSVGLTIFHFAGVRGGFDFIPGLTSFVVFLFAYRRGSWVFKTMWIFISWVMMSAVSMIVMSLLTLIPGVEIEAIFGETPIRVVGVICINIALIPFVILLPRLQKEQRLSSPYTPQTLIVMLCIPVASVIFLLLIQHYYVMMPVAQRSSLSVYAASFLGLFIGVASLWLFDRVASQARHLAQTEADISQLHMEQKHQKDMQTIYDQMRMWKHDYNNRVGVMRALAENKQFDELTRYIQQNSQSFDSITDYANTGNSALDALLNMKNALAKPNQITMTTEVVLPATLPMSDGDFCALLGNLLDNAIEANERMPEGAERYMHLEIKALQGNLQINIENPTNGTVRRAGKIIISSKLDKTMHGFGLRSVEKIVADHRGYVNIKHGENVFAVAILLPIS